MYHLRANYFLRELNQTELVLVKEKKKTNKHIPKHSANLPPKRVGRETVTGGRIDISTQKTFAQEM